MSKPDLQLSVGVDTKPGEKNLAEFQTEFNKLTDEIKKPLGDISAFVQMKKNLKEAEAEFAAAEQRCAELARQIKATEDPPRKLSKSFETAKKEAAALKESLTNQRTALQDLRRSLSSAGINTSNLASEQIRLKRTLQETRKAAAAQAEMQQELAAAQKTLGVKPLNEIQSEVVKLEKAYKTLKASGTASMAELARAKLKVAEKTRELERETGNWIASLDKVKGGLAGLAASGAGWALAVNAAKDFESAMSDVAKVVDAPAEKLKSLEQTILSLTRVIPMTAVELARIAEAGGQMGIAADQIEEFVTATAKISTAFKMSAEAAGETVGKLMNVWHLNVAGVSDLTDSINALGNEFNTTESKISEVLVRIGAMPKMFGLSAKEAAALSAAMLSIGKTPEVAATGINALLSKLQTANAQTNEFKAALSSLGISARQLAVDINEHPQQALLAFLDTLATLDKKTKAETLTKLFGQEYQDDVAAAVESLDLYRRTLAVATDQTKTSGSVNREVERGMQNLRNQLALAKNAVTELGIVLGTSLLPLMKGATTTIKGTATAITDLAAMSPGLANVVLLIGNIALGFGTLAVVGKASVAVLAKIFQPMITACVAARASLTALATTGTEAVASMGAMQGASAGLAATLGGLGAAVTAVGAAWGTWQIANLIQEMNTARQAAKDLAAVAESYKQTAKEFEDYKDLKARGLDELKQLSADELQTELNNLEKYKSYWVRYRESLAIKSEERNFLGFLTVDAEKAAIELMEVDRRLEEMQGRFAVLGEAARATGVELQLFEDKARSAGEAAKEIADPAIKAQGELRAALAHLGVDLETLASGLTSAAKDHIDTFDAIVANGWSSSTQIIAAFDAILPHLQNLKEVDAADAALKRAFDAGKISAGEFNAQIAKLQGRFRELVEATNPVEQAFKRLGVTSAQSLDMIAETAKRDYETIKKSGAAAATDIEKAWVAKAEKQIAAAKAHGAAEERVTRQILNTEAAMLGFGKAAEKAGILGEEAGNKTAKGMEAAAEAARKAAEEIDALRKQNDALQKELEQAATKRESDEAPQATPKTTPLYNIPNWDMMSDEMQKRMRQVVTSVNATGYTELAKEQELALRNQVKAAVQGLESLKKDLSGKEMTSSLAQATARSIGSIKGILKDELLSDLEGSVKDFYARRTEESLKGIRSPEKSDKESEKTVVAKEQPKIEQPQQVTIQPQPTAEIKIEPQQPADIKIEQPEGTTAQRLDERRNPPRQTEQQAKTDDRPLKTLEQIAFTLRDIERGISTLVSLSRGGSSSYRANSQDLARGVLTAISDAASRT